MRKEITAVLLFSSILAFSAPTYAQGKSNKQEPPAKKGLIARADADGDGKLSREEFMNFERSRAEKAFERLDGNKDGFISKDEATKRNPPKQKPKTGSSQ